MLKMDQVSIIRDRYFNLQHSVRRIARELELSRNTVKKYVGEAEPVRKQRKVKERPVRDEAQEKVQEVIERLRGRTTAKQAITGTLLHLELQKEGLQVGISTVREIVAERRREEAEVFVPLIHRPGEAQVDFFEVTLEIAGQRIKAWMFLMRLMYSGRDFAWIYPCCDQVAFLDGHVRAFEHFGGVVLRAIYDNLKPAVKKIVMGTRQLTPRFKAIVNHYRFEHSFCRPGEGHDKGGVEARGSGVRSEHLTPIPQADSLQAASLRLLTDIDGRVGERRDAAGRTTLERFHEETCAFRSLPAAPFEPRKTIPVGISSQSMVRVEGADYSVPEAWARLSATAYYGPYDVLITCRGESVIKARADKGGRNVEYRHYLRELSRKPQAVRQVAPELVAELGEPFGRLWSLLVAAHGELDAARVLSKVLGAMLLHGEETVREAVAVALQADRVDLLALKSHLHGPVVRTVPVPPALAGYQIDHAQASDYDHLMEAV